MKYQPHEHIPASELPDGTDPKLANSFKNFLYMVWHSLGLPEPTANQYAIAHRLQYGPEDQQIIAFRGLGKSYITGPFCVWALYRDPDCQVLTTSATGGFAGDNARFAWTIIHTFEWLAHMRPTQDQQRSATDFDVRGAKPAKGTSFAARGITGQITGLRADIIVGDDLETPNTSSTPGAREELRRRAGEFTAIGKPGHRKLLLGTPQCEETIYRDNEAKGYSTLIIPIEYPTEEEIVRYGEHRLAPHILTAVRGNPALAGTTTEPTRFDAGAIERNKMQWGNTEYQRQFKMFMDAGAGIGTPLKLRNLIVLPLSPYTKGDSKSGVPEVLAKPDITDNPIDLKMMGVQIDCLTADRHLFAPKETSRWKKPDLTVLHVDPSGVGLDETSWAVTAGLSSRVYLLAVNSRLEGYSADTMDAICDDVIRWGVQKVEVEDNFGGGMFGNLLKARLQERKIKNCQVNSERVAKQSKEARIVDILEPLTTARRLIVNLDVFTQDFDRAETYDSVPQAKRRFYRFAYQYTRMEKTKNALPRDDRIDSVASACKFWIDRLQETEKAAEDRNFEEAMREEFDRMNQLRIKQGLPLLDINANPGDIEGAILRVQAKLGIRQSGYDRTRSKGKRRRRW